VNTHNEDILPGAGQEVEALEGPSLGLDVGTVIPDGLSDPDESSDDADHIVDVSDLQRFASALQEAQHRAVQLESEKAKQKRKTPKTYQGNSKKTLYRREKARKALAAKGFHDVFSFMALKKKSEEKDGGQSVMFCIGLTIICLLRMYVSPLSFVSG
jgi:hypothetical protein